MRAGMPASWQRVSAAVLAMMRFDARRPIRSESNKARRTIDPDWRLLEEAGVGA